MKGEIMNFKKIFSSCLSVLIASAPVSLRAMQDGDCAVCLDIIRNETVAKCGHKFCGDCLDAWTQKQPVCPICKKYIGNGIDLTEDFKRWGIIDVRDLPEMKGKSDEKIIDYLIENYCDILKGEFICTDTEESITQQKKRELKTQEDYVCSMECLKTIIWPMCLWIHLMDARE